jgi:hypothetical protein
MVAELLDREDREERAARRAAENAARAQALEAEHRSVAALRDVLALADAAMLCTGHHKVKRQWRRRRAPMKNELAKTSRKAPTPVPVPGSIDEIQALADRLEGHGGSSALPALRKALASGHDVKGKRDFFMHRYGDPYDLLEFEATRRSYGKTDKTEVKRMAVRMELAEKRDAIAGPDATLIERLLAERITFSWWELVVWQTVQAINPTAP